jgi:hypothetical protein
MRRNTASDAGARDAGVPDDGGRDADTQDGKGEDDSRGSPDAKDARDAQNAEDGNSDAKISKPGTKVFSCEITLKQGVGAPYLPASQEDAETLKWDLDEVREKGSSFKTVTFLSEEKKTKYKPRKKLELTVNLVLKLINDDRIEASVSESIADLATKYNSDRPQMLVTGAPTTFPLEYGVEKYAVEMPAPRSDMPEVAIECRIQLTH